MDINTLYVQYPLTGGGVPRRKRRYGVGIDVALNGKMDELFVTGSGDYLPHGY